MQVSLPYPKFVICWHTRDGGRCHTPRLTFVLFGCSLDNNVLCGIDERGNGTYTTEGIVVLMQGVKNSKIQSLR